jgi:hypothetical protein
MQIATIGLDIAKIEDATIDPRHAARLIRQHRLNGRSLVVREFVTHDSAPSVGA